MTIELPAGESSNHVVPSATDDVLTEMGASKLSWTVEIAGIGGVPLAVHVTELEAVAATVLSPAPEAEELPAEEPNVTVVVPRSARSRDI